MKKKNVVYSIATAIALVLIISCSGCSGISTGFTKVADAITNPTAREVYAREFKDNKEQFMAWESAYSNAIADSLQVTLPYGERGDFVPYSNRTYAYTFQLEEGEVLVANVVKDSVSQRVFMNVFEQRASGWEHAESNTTGDSTLEFKVAETGMYKIIIQPEVLANTDFFISLNKRPLYAFPVAGKGNAAIGSFWGMERDGGKRNHEGIDIFAKKGTPVVAVTNGTISFTGERGLGGRQVWLRDGLFGKSLYYAHLDSIAVQGGMNVKTGDTLGFVGNTGNAKTTPPHLHFGIYQSGAINPLPFVYQTNPVTEAKFSRSFKTTQLKVKGTANLRQAPDTKSNTLGALTANDTVALLGQNNDWLHIQTPAGKKAFIHKSLVREIKG
ncbi:peptidoglycan DD-metalloendopeptidase family protein [Flavobacterium rivuli]|uniref:peptidoglycan DD-metalloendopeptidase family protein n=1 Tax=Flavobacterium rivuli TaxID=498301 RepID=UPI00036CC281|nr:M23 family metallopeptidase [Flavobacterium rivuli]